MIWIQGADIADWERPHRISRKTTITVEHIMASAAIPLFFPPVQLDDGWYGDGNIHLTDIRVSPLSISVHDASSLFQTATGEVLAKHAAQ